MERGLPAPHERDFERHLIEFAARDERRLELCRDPPLRPVEVETGRTDDFHTGVRARRAMAAQRTLNRQCAALGTFRDRQFDPANLSPVKAALAQGHRTRAHDQA